MSEAASLLSAYAAHHDQTVSTSKGNRVDLADCGPPQPNKPRAPETHSGALGAFGQRMDNEKREDGKTVVSEALEAARDAMGPTEGERCPRMADYVRGRR